MKKRIMCSGAACHMCRNVVFEGKDSQGNKLYSCAFKREKHKKVYASDCKHFVCSDSRGPFCRDCERK